jgi:hypothetical protein
VSFPASHSRWGPHPQPVTRESRQTTLLGLVIVAMVLLWPDTAPRQLPPSGVQQLAGTVTAVKAQPCPPAPQGDDANPTDQAGPAVCGTADVRLGEGSAARSVTYALRLEWAPPGSP